MPKTLREFLDAAGDPAVSREARLEALRGLVSSFPAEGPVGSAGSAAAPATGEVNNHIHTVYSFSPYTPSMAAYRARASGLAAAGSVDHDSVGAAEEMLEASAILGIGATVGFELRVSVKDSPFAERKINNPDSRGVIYMTIQGLPRAGIGKAADFLKPIGAAREERNRAMLEGMNRILTGSGYRGLDYGRDVLPLSRKAEGGSVTERHLLAAAAYAVIERHGRGAELVSGIAKNLGVQAPPKIAAWLSDASNPHYVYDLLGLLKSSFLDRVFIQPGARECVPAREAVAFARSVGAIPAYAYLGDVADSPTGDKKAEKFEDDFLDDLLPFLSELGFQALAYMPPRNTAGQIARLRKLASRQGFMEISGVDINSSRQSFNCPEVLAPDMSQLLDATWALIAHERLSDLDPALGLFSPAAPLAGMRLPERVARYAALGRSLDPRDPGAALRLEAGLKAWRSS